MKFCNPEKIRIHLPESLIFFLKMKKIGSETIICSHEYPYRGKRRNHFIFLKNSRKFGIVVGILLQNSSLHVAVSLLDVVSHMDDYSDIPILFDSGNRDDLAFFQPDEIEPAAFYTGATEIDGKEAQIMVPMHEPVN